MKRLLLFLGLLATGFALLALLLREDDLFRNFSRSTITAEDLGELEAPIPYHQGGDELIVSMPRSWEGALTDTVSIDLPQLEGFDQGVVSARPVLTFYDEGHVLRGRVTAQRATIHAPNLRFEELQHSRLQIQSIDLEGDVEATWMDANARPTLVLHSQRAHLPGELLQARNGVRSPPVLFPDPLVVQRIDGSLELSGSSGRLDLGEHVLEIAPPLRLYARDAPWAAAPGEPATAPLEVTAAGPLRYRWEEAPRNGSQPEALGARALQGGTLVVTDQVLARQEDRWVRAEKLVLELARRPAPAGEIPEDSSSEPALEVVRWVAGDGIAPVTCGLFGGAGTALLATYEAATEHLEFQGPAVFQDLSFAESGGEEMHLELLKAREHATLQRRGPDQFEMELAGDAVLRGSQVDATGKTVRALLERTAEDRGSRFSLERLEVLVDGRLEFGGEEGQGSIRGTGTGAQLVVQRDAQGHTLDITGQAHLALRGGPTDRFENADLSGPSLHASFPASSTQPYTLTVPQLTDASILLPASSSFLATESSADVPLLLVVTPESSAHFEGSGKRFEFDGRCRYELSQEHELSQATVPLQTLSADHLLLEEKGEVLTAQATGAVHCRDEARDVELDGDHVDLGPILVGRGRPARVVAHQEGSTLSLFGAEIRYDTHTGTLRAKASSEALASLEVPERFLQEVLPERAGVPAEEGLVTLDAEELVLMGSGEAADAAAPPTAALASLHATGSVHAVRVSDGLELSGDELRLDRREQSATLRADAGQLAELRRPFPDVPDQADRLRAHWMRFRNGGVDADLAPGAEMVFYLRREDAAASSTPPGRRVSLEVGDEVHLRGTEIQCTGGVDTHVQLRDRDLHARSDRVLLVLDQPAVERGRPRQILAQQGVVLTHEDFRCTGSLLAFDFESNWLELKAGVEPCRILSSSNLLPLPVDSRFHRLRSRITDDRDEFPVNDLRLEHFELLAGNGEPAAVVEAEPR